MRISPFLLVVTAACCFAPSPSKAAVGDWTSYSRFIVRRVAATSTEVWAATEGGIIHSNLSSGSVRTYSPTDGLPDKSILSVFVDGGTTWFGSNEGGLLRFTKIPGLDVPKLDLPPLLAGQITTVRALAADTCNLYVGHSTGITVLHKATDRVVETYHQLGSPPEIRNAQVTALAVIGNRLVAGLDRGLSYASLDDDLLLPSSWTYLVQVGGLRRPDAAARTRPTGAAASAAITIFDSVAAITASGDDLYVATRYGVQRERGSEWSNVLPNSPARDLAVFDEAVWAATDAGLFMSSDGETWTQVPALSGPVRALAAVPERMLVAAGSEGTFRFDSKDDTSATKVPGVDIPPSDSFTHLAVDTSGAVWVAPGRTPFLMAEPGVNRLGIFALKGNRWLHFPSGADGLLWPPPEELRSGYVSIAVDGGNRVWAGTWGTGISIIDQASDPPSISSLTYDNSALTGLRDAPQYTVIDALLPDPSGAMWAAVRNSLAFAMSRDSGQTQFTVRHVAGPFIASTQIGDELAPSALGLDHFGVLWIGTLSSGIVLLDTGGTPFDGSDDQFAGTIGLEDVTPGPGLPSWMVSAIAVDREGVVWVGTDKGLAKFVGTYDRSGNVYLLNAEHLTVNDGLPSDKVQALIVDSANVKWVGTDNGLAQILASGQVASLASTRLVDPAGNVVALAFDAKRGYLWVGTPRGLNRYEVYPPPGESEELLTAQPSQNPFRIGLSVRGQDYVLTGKPLTMLVSPGATVRVYTITGELVWEQTDGGIGQVAWDGRTSGRTGVVASGIYLYVVERNGQRRLGKIAVLRDAR